MKTVFIKITIKDCGTGAGGFQPGNDCADGDGGGENGGSSDSTSGESLSTLIPNQTPAQLEDISKLKGVIDPKDSHAKGMLIQITERIPIEHCAGIKTIQSAESLTVMRDGVVVEGNGTYSLLSDEIKVVFSGENERSGTLIHEIGHHVHERRLTPQAELEWRSISDNGKNARISHYARVSRGEHFAEAYRYFNLGKDFRAHLKKHEPLVHNFFQKMHKSGSKMLHPNGGLGKVDFERWGDKTKKSVYNKLFVKANASRAGEKMTLGEFVPNVLSGTISVVGGGITDQDQYYTGIADPLTLTNDDIAAEAIGHDVDVGELNFDGIVSMVYEIRSERKHLITIAMPLR